MNNNNKNKLYDDSPARIYLNDLIEKRRLEGQKVSRTGLSIMLGKSRGYLQQYLTIGTIKNLNSEVIYDLARILKGDPRQMTDTPEMLEQNISSNKRTLGLILETIDEWLIENKRLMLYEDKAELIIALCQHPLIKQDMPAEQKKAKIIELADFLTNVKAA